MAASRKANPATCADRSPKNLPALLVEALNETVVVTIDGERRVGRVLTGRGVDGHHRRSPSVIGLPP